MKLLFFFLDGVGLGQDDPAANPFSRAAMPTLERLLHERRLVAGSAPFEGSRATLLALDAQLGVDGLPQSATGQATLLTGQNVPAAIGYHYGPKPNPPVAEFLRNGNLFSQVRKKGQRANFLNAYPPRYFEAIASGRRMYSAIPLAATSAGLPLMTGSDLHSGQALAADFTGAGWRDNLGLLDTPLLTPFQAGERLAALASAQDFSFFEYWLSDYAGHRQDMEQACALLETLDQVLEGLLYAWDDFSGLVLLTSDHGNLENLNTRRHTLNPVLCLLIGAPELRREFISHAKASAGWRSDGVERIDLSDIAPAIMGFLGL